MDRYLGGLWFIVVPGWLWAFLPPLFASTGGVIDIWAELLLFVTGTPLALAWVIGSVVARKRVRGWSLCVWGSVPAAWLVAVLLVAASLPLMARLVISERELIAYSEGDDPDPPRYVDPKPIGAFEVSRVWRAGTAVAFMTAGSGFDKFGVVYAPDGLPPKPLPEEAEELGWATIAHLYGPWYRFEIPD